MNNRHHRSILALIVIMLLTIAGISIAFSESEPTYRNIIEDAYISEWTDILGLSSLMREAPGSLDIDTLPALSSENTPDIFMTDYGILLTAKQSGYLCKFKPSPEMLAEYEEMPRIVKELLSPMIVADDGSFYGYPNHINAEAMMFWVPDAWSASPFKNITPPQSFSELLDFLEIYLNTPHDGFCFYYDVWGDNHPEQDWIDVPDENRITMKTAGKKHGDLCMTQGYVDSIRDMHQYAVPCSVNEIYLDGLPYRYFQRQYKLERSFINGDITAEDFAIQLGRLPEEKIDEKEEFIQ